MGGTDSTTNLTTNSTTNAVGNCKTTQTVEQIEQEMKKIDVEIKAIEDRLYSACIRSVFCGSGKAYPDADISIMQYHLDSLVRRYNDLYDKRDSLKRKSNIFDSGKSIFGIKENSSTETNNPYTGKNDAPKVSNDSDKFLL